MGNENEAFRCLGAFLSASAAEQEVYMRSLLPKEIQNKRRGHGRTLSARPPAEPPFPLEKLEEMPKETEKNG